jgi:DNA-binding IclR family transcriptional regulator
MRLVEHRFGRSIDDLLRALRVGGATEGEIAAQIGVPAGTVHRWLVRFELDDASLIRKALQETSW